MSALKKIQDIQAKNKSIICLGLDLDTRKMPNEYAKSIKGMFDFVTQVIDATKDHVCAYKPNLAFYESLGPEGMSLLHQLRRRIPDEIPVIIDGKRNDIGNTAAHYAEALYDRLNADWVTVNPYMGYDSMRPFIDRRDKGVFILCLTSNAGHKDFQMLQVEGRPLYEVVASKVAYWNKDDSLGLVVGATAPEQLKQLRVVAEDMPLLIPGVGAQGGSLEKAAAYGTADFTKPAVINVSRSVLYASRESDFAQRSRQELIKLNSMVRALQQAEMDEPATQPSPESTVPPESPISDTPPPEVSAESQSAPSEDQKSNSYNSNE